MYKKGIRSMVRIQKKVDRQEEPEDPDYSPAKKQRPQRVNVKKFRKAFTNAKFTNNKTDLVYSSFAKTDNKSSTQMIQSFLENQRPGTNSFARPKFKNLKQISEVRFAKTEWTPKMTKLKRVAAPRPKLIEEIETKFDQCEYEKREGYVKRLMSPCREIDSINTPRFLKVEDRGERALDGKDKRYCCSVGHNFEEENQSAKFKGERAHYRNMNETLLSWVIDDDDSDESLNLGPQEIAKRRNKVIMTCLEKNVVPKYGSKKLIV